MRAKKQLIPVVMGGVALMALIAGCQQTASEPEETTEETTVETTTEETVPERTVVVERTVIMESETPAAPASGRIVPQTNNTEPLPKGYIEPETMRSITEEEARRLIEGR
jgi:hypothetical protein